MEPYFQDILSSILPPTSGAVVSPSILEGVVESIFIPGLNDQVTLVMRGSFGGLFLVYGFLIWATWGSDFTLHILFMMCVSLCLWGCIEW